MRRPNPLLWLYYQYGGRLPPSYRDWVRHDATCRTWLVRVLLRTIVWLAPIFAVLLVVLVAVGGSWSIALGAILLGVLVALRFTLANAMESVDARLVKYGFPPGHTTATSSALLTSTPIERTTCAILPLPSLLVRAAMPAQLFGFEEDGWRHLAPLRTRWCQGSLGIAQPGRPMLLTSAVRTEH